MKTNNYQFVPFLNAIFSRKLLLILVTMLILVCSSVQATAQVLTWDGGIRGVLLVGKFRTQQQLNLMSIGDKRNTLITELAGRTTDTVGYYQSLNDDELAGIGATLVFLRKTSRTDPQIKLLSADDMRNLLIVSVGTQTGRGRDLQGLSNMQLIQLVLGENIYLRGVLLVGKFRTQQQLNKMSLDDMRNTLITELAGRTKNTVGFYQSLSNVSLAGVGALLVYLRETDSRTDSQIKKLTTDGMRNIVIVEVGVQTGRGRDLQGLSNIDLMKLVLRHPTSFLH